MNEEGHAPESNGHPQQALRGGAFLEGSEDRREEQAPDTCVNV